MGMMIHRHMKKVAEKEKSATASVKPKKKEVENEKQPVKKAGRPKKEQ